MWIIEARGDLYRMVRCVARRAVWLWFQYGPWFYYHLVFLCVASLSSGCVQRVCVKRFNSTVLIVHLSLLSFLPSSSLPSTASCSPQVVVVLSYALHRRYNGGCRGVVSRDVSAAGAGKEKEGGVISSLCRISPTAQEKRCVMLLCVQSL